MKLLNIPRGCRKSQYLIKEAVQTGKPILVATSTSKKSLIMLAQSIHIDSNEIKIFTVREILSNTLGGKYTIPTMDIVQKEYLVDELPLVFEEMMRVLASSTIGTATITAPMTEVIPLAISF